MARISKVYLVSDEEFIEIIENADSFSDCLRALGLTTSGGSSTDILKKRINELKCDTSHFGSNPKTGGARPKIPLDEVLVENSTYANIASLKNRLVREGRLEYKCAKCGICEW